MWKKLILVALVLAIVIVFFLSGLHHHLTLESIKASSARFQDLYHTRPLAVVGLYLLVYLIVVPLNLPGATVLGLLAGALFGSLAGTLIVSFASSVGATLACALSRYLLRDWVRAKFPQAAARVDAGVRREGSFYLFSMRLIPVIPFFMINMVMGLTAMRLSTFYWVSQLGMLPGTFVFVNAGSQLAQLTSTASILSPRLLLSLALLGIFPLVAKRLLNLYRVKTGRECKEGFEEEMLPPDMPVVSPVSLKATFADGPGSALAEIGGSMAKGCTRCGACVKQCAFLQKYGMPGEIAGQVMAPSNDGSVADPFECSLCDLCGAVCPEKLSPAGFFLEMRRQAVEKGALDLGRYKGILGYEARGQSERYSWYGLPEGCDTVFFPGCTLPGTRPEATWRIFELLRREAPNLGVVLDCCAKPSHDLGRAGHFHASFSTVLDYLSAHGIRNVWVACPNCYKVFEQYGTPFEVTTVWERLLAAGAFQDKGLAGSVMVHDPCPLRHASGIHEAVREGITQMGLTVKEARHKKKLTLCCGEGGSVGFINPTFAKKWGAKRKAEAQGERLVTYCAGCAGFLKRAGATVTHLADFLVSPEAASAGRPRVSGAPWTYWNRIKLKKRFQEAVAAANAACQPAAIRKAGADACTLEECRSVLCRKGACLALVFALTVGVYFLIERFMYVLDAYVYTAEFHLLFMQSNLEKANLPLFSEYFQSLGPIRGLPHLVLACFVQNVLKPLSPPILIPSLTAAFGSLRGGLVGFAGLGLTALLFFGIGRFFLGEILPLLRRSRASLSRVTESATWILMAVPVVPLVLPALLGAATRIRLRRFILMMTGALLIRVILQTAWV